MSAKLKWRRRQAPQSSDGMDLMLNGWILASVWPWPKHVPYSKAPNRNEVAWSYAVYEYSNGGRMGYMRGNIESGSAAIDECLGHVRKLLAQAGVETESEVSPPSGKPTEP